MPNKIFYTYDHLIQGINSISRQMTLDDWRPDYVVGVLRGGVIPAVHLSHWWNVKMFALPWTTRDNMTDESKDISSAVALLSKSKNVLLVDDICDTAKTFKEIVDSIKVSNDLDYNSKHFRTAALHYNIGQDLFEPDYYHVEINKEDDPSWIVYPWEA